MSEAPPPHAHPELADPRARPLNDAEVEALAALRPLVGPVEADEKSDDAALLRFLRARRLNVAQAHEMHKKWVQWRKDFKVDQLNIANFKREIASGKAFWFGYDKMKRPCLFILPRYHRPSKARFQQTIQHGVWLVEEGVRRAEALGSTQICVVYDREGMTSSNRDPQILQLGKNLTGMLQDNYAERLGAYYILNVNWFFWLMHKIISPLLSEETRAKIKILRAPSATDHPLLEFFDADQLPREYGGTADFKYNPRDILGNLLDDDEKEDKLVEGNTVFSLEDSVSVRALGSFELPAEINERVLAPLDAQSKPGAVCAVRVSWSFTTVKGDISFAVNFTPNLIAGTGDAEPLPAQTDAPESEPIVEPARVEAHLKPIEGSCVLRNPGKLQFVWDNRFSLFTAKQLKYSVRCTELLEPQPQQTAE